MFGRIRALQIFPLFSGWFEFWKALLFFFIRIMVLQAFALLFQGNSSFASFCFCKTNSSFANVCSFFHENSSFAIFCFLFYLLCICFCVVFNFSSNHIIATSPFLINKPPLTGHSYLLFHMFACNQ